MVGLAKQSAMGDHPMKWNLLQFSKTLHETRRRGENESKKNLPHPPKRTLHIFPCRKTGIAATTTKTMKEKKSPAMMYRYMYD